MATPGERRKPHWAEGASGLQCNDRPQRTPHGTLTLGWPFRVVPNWDKGWAVP